MNHDKLSNANSQLASRACMAVANGVQMHKPEEQVLGAAAFFLFICEAYKVRPGSVLDLISNMINSDKLLARDQFNAARMYVKEEIANVVS